ncbi:MAG: adenosylhomocysteinase [Candidatus Doudnabacteria bacterium]|nr:adenosylhomocysteinase [Candidatus Doudnabacteria bacterium]
MKYDIKNLKLAEAGLKKIRWAAQEMPVLGAMTELFRKTKPFRNLRIGACLHVSTETANLLRALKAGGARVFLCASNPLSTKDDVCAALVAYEKIPVFAKAGVSRKTFYAHLNSVLQAKPEVIIDDGADLIGLLHTSHVRQAKRILGACEETTTGVNRLKSLSKAGKLLFPVVAVNDAQIKHLFDNRYGTGQSAIDGILRATNFMLAGKKFVVAGYGWVGRGVASRASGMGAEVIVTEINPIRAIEARMDGYSVMTMNEASKIGDIFVTATGNINVIGGRHFSQMKNGAILSNVGHFNVEVNIGELEKLAKKKEQVRREVTAYQLSKDKTLFLLSEGRLVNLAAAEGHPASIMDLSFAAQAKAVEFIIKNRRKLKKQIYTLPPSVDQEIASLKLKSFGIEIDKPGKEQEAYMSGWETGT